MRLDATEALAPHDVPFRVTDRLIGDEDVGTVLAPCGDEAAHDEQSVVALGGKVLHLAVDGGRQRDSGPVEVHRASIGSRCGDASVGGEMLPVEVAVIPNGTGKIEITGSLGDVMKESAQLAVTYAKVHAEEYGIAADKFKKTDLHIHAPEGAVPKDGPSAGVTLTTALVSCLSGVPVRGDVAMTGEITLHGNVLPIGGLREKSMAAYREGMKTVLIPKDNEPDLYDVDEEVKKNLTFLPMQNLSQVLAAALLKPKAAKSTAGRPRTKKSKAGESRIPAAPEKNQPGAVC